MATDPIARASRYYVENPPMLEPISPAGSIALNAITTFRERTANANATIAAARRDMRNKVRLAYGVPYHEWQEALEAGDWAIGALLERYSAPHWRKVSPPAFDADRAS